MKIPRNDGTNFADYLLGGVSISAIAIDEGNRKWFGTSSNGVYLISDDNMEDNVWAYPNPVKPDYTGLITITGLSFQADVKIVTSNGVLVNQGKSNGGSYTWDGRNRKGEKVASGIYMVETATNEGNQGTVCKIAIIR